jgi:hypothetical protein
MIVEILNKKLVVFINPAHQFPKMTIAEVTNDFNNLFMHSNKFILSLLAQK